MTNTQKTQAAIKAVDDQIFVREAMFRPTFDLLLKRESLVAMLPNNVIPFKPAHLWTDPDQEAADAEYEDNYSL